MRFLLTISLALVYFSLSGCGIKAWWAKEFRQKEIADGLSRLSVQYMSGIVSEASREFDGENAVVIEQPSDDPKEHGKGHVIWQLEDIEIHHPEAVHFYKDCQGNKAFWRGKARISAKKILYGRLTNNKKNPIIPDPGTLRIEVEATVYDLKVYFPGKDGHLELERGTFVFEAYPRLAQGSNGMRVVPTSNTRFSKVRLKNVKGMLFSTEVDMPIEISDANLEAQVGLGDDGKENDLSGHITIFENRHQVPFDRKGLDPGYNADDFIASFACNPDLSHGLSYEHIAVEERLAPAVAGFSARALGHTATELEKNKECGFLSAGAVNSLELKGAVGGDGQFISTLPAECRIRFEQLHNAPNCFGEASIVSGTIVVKKAQKILNGFVFSSVEDLARAKKNHLDKIIAGATIDELQLAFPKAVLPKTLQPVEIILEVELENLTIQETCLHEGKIDDPEHCSNKKKELITFSASEGEVTGILKPYLAKDLRADSATKNSCSLPTPISEASVDIRALKSSIDRAGSKVHFLVDGSFQLINGRIGAVENLLRGHLNIGTHKLLFESAEKDYIALDSFYNWDNFQRSFLSCASEIALPLSDEECIPEELIKEDLVRLVVRNAGAFLKVGSTGFNSLSAIRTRELKDEGNTLILKTTKKTITIASKDIHRSIDALNNELIIEGQVNALDGQMLRKGESINKSEGFLNRLNPFRSRFAEAYKARRNNSQEIFVRPTKAQSSTIELSATMRDFTAIDKPFNKEVGPYLIFHNGKFAITARPVMGIDRRTIHDTTPSHSIPTPVVEFDSIRIQHSEARIKSPVMNFLIFIEHAELYAMNGFYEGRGNTVSGIIRFNVGSKKSQKIIEYKFNDIELVRNFSQRDFDASYANTLYLNHVIVPK